MKILFLTDNFPPEVNAPANRTYEHCREWVKAGAEVTVITCFPNFPQGRVYDGYKNRGYKEECISGIRVIRVWTYISANKGFIRRTLDYISFAIMGFIATLFVKTDIIIATSPQFFTAVAGNWAAFWKRKPWIMEVRDLWPESIKAVDAVGGNRIIDWLERLELLLYRRARKIVVVTDAFKSNISGRGIPAEKIEVVKNGVHIDQYAPAPKEENLISSLQLENKFVVGYIGTHGMAHKLDFILRSAQHVNSNIHFLFIGDGAEKEKLLELHQDLQLGNVSLHAPVPKSEIKQYISITDIALVPLKKSDTFKTVIPSKIFENAAMQKPILLGVEGESQQIIESYQAGLCFKPEDEEDFLKQLNKLAKDKDLYAELQQGCASLAQDFDRKVLAKKMLDIIEQTIDSGGQ